MVRSRRGQAGNALIGKGGAAVEGNFAGCGEKTGDYRAKAQRRDKRDWSAGGQAAQRFFGRSFTRMTNRRPDQVSSTAQTLLSTRPVARPMGRMMVSVSSVSTPDDFFGQ